ncbi:MAG: lipid-A-disaccharide synthase [Pseudomonadota bacterium]|nr:lipid-A-disaccharide synthase [Pseudomonadota bacterium]
MSTPTLRVGIVAGELSGDTLGANLMRDLQRQYPNAEFVGIGGPQMQAAGLISLYPMERLSVMGLVEVLGRLRELFQIRDGLLEQFTGESRIDVFIGIDSPDFNLRVSARLKPLGIRTVQYVSPSVWAWRQGRVHGIRAAVDLVLCLFPFEVAFYQQHDVNAVFVGHPLATQLPLNHQSEQGKKVFGMTPDRRVVALLPGSRAGEVSRLTPLLLDVARQLYQEDPELRFLIPAANLARDHQIRVLRDALPEPLRHAVRIIKPQDDGGQVGRQVMAASDLVILASGTATLEGLLLRRPMVVVYQVHWLTYLLAKYLVKIKHVALPNILAGQIIVPELIQKDATPVHVVAAARNLLAHPDLMAQQQQALHKIHTDLQGAQSANAAAAVLALLQLDNDHDAA